MIFFEDGTILTFKECDEKPDQTWVNELGCYGTGSGFDVELAFLPKVDISRLESKMSTYKACNTQCDYCLERYFDEAFADEKFSPYPKHEFIYDSILKYKPSYIEITGGEIFQDKNIKTLKKLCNFLDEIDPNKKIRLEIISNGFEKELIKEFYKDKRFYISISFDPNEIDGDNYRHLENNKVFNTIVELSKIDKSRLLVFWMLSTHTDFDKIDFYINELEKRGINWTIQPINDVIGFFKGNENYDLNFIKKMIEHYPFIIKDYSFINLLYPRISCLEGSVVLKSQNTVTNCIFRESRDNYPPHKHIIDASNELIISAGVAHVCSLISEEHLLNYKEIERLAYTMIGINLLSKNKPIKEMVENIKNIYRYMLEFKNTILATPLMPHVGEKIVVELVYPQSEATKQMIVRLGERIGLKINNIYSNYDFDILKDDQWTFYKDGKDMEFIFYEDYLIKTFENEDDKLYCVVTYNNFPCRMVIIGQNKDIQNMIFNNENNIYPKEYGNAVNALPLITHHIVGELII